jgi:hypothetical protein
MIPGVLPTARHADSITGIQTVAAARNALRCTRWGFTDTLQPAALGSATSSQTYAPQSAPHYTTSCLQLLLGFSLRILISATTNVTSALLTAIRNSISPGMLPTACDTDLITGINCLNTNTNWKGAGCTAALQRMMSSCNDLHAGS